MSNAARTSGQAAGHVEQADRVGELVEDLLDVQLAVGAGRVVEVQVDRDAQAGDDAGRGDADADARLGVHLTDEADLGHVDTVDVEVVEEDAVEQVHARTTGQHLAQTTGVVADDEPALHRDRAAHADGDGDGPDHDRREVVAEAGGGLQRTDVVADERDVLAHHQPEDRARVVDERERQTRHTERARQGRLRDGGGFGRGRAHRAGRGATGGGLGVDLQQRTGRGASALDQLRGLGRALRQTGLGTVDVEATAAQAVERDVALGDLRVVDELDERGQALDERQVVAADRLHQAEQRDRRLADQFGQIADHRDRRGERVDDRLERTGDLAHLVGDRLDELAEQRLEVEVDVVEADRGRRDRLALVPRPRHVERADELGEAGVLATDDAGAEAQVQRGVDADHRLQLDVADVGEAQRGLAAVGDVEADAHGGVRLGVGLACGAVVAVAHLHAQEGELAAEATVARPVALDDGTGVVGQRRQRIAHDRTARAGVLPEADVGLQGELGVGATRRRQRLADADVRAGLAAQAEVDDEAPTDARSEGAGEAQRHAVETQVERQRGGRGLTDREHDPQVLHRSAGSPRRRSCRPARRRSRGTPRCRSPPRWDHRSASSGSRAARCRRPCSAAAE